MDERFIQNKPNTDPLITGLREDRFNQQVIKGDPTSTAPAGGVINADQLRIWTEDLSNYKAGKAQLEHRVVNAERWWKLRNQYVEQAETEAVKEGFQSTSAWLHNVLNSKHAAYLEAYPTVNILPREQQDKVEAWALSKIIPVILKHNNFEQTYDENGWQKLKTGCGVYKVFWDNKKLNGLGDISVTRRDLLSIYWEPGINNIQDSKEVFDVELRDKDELIEEYPELLNDRVLADVVTPTKFPTDDNVPKDNKVSVIDIYYHRHGKLHYCKYVGETVLYATENDTEQRIRVDTITGQQTAYTRAEEGLYQHGKFPYVFDTLFPIEGSPAGYGYVDICANAQTRIDLLNRALLKNALASATPRAFIRTDGNINREQFLNLEQALIEVPGGVDDTQLRFVQATPMSGNIINYENLIIQELRETSGNTETSTGSSSHGVTAASALAALQEASGKTSRASTITTYRAFGLISDLIIELIRQFYDLPRQFRITGSMGVERFITFQNSFMQPQQQGMIGGQDMGYRVPVYDIEVEPEKKTRYTKMAENELAIQLLQLGFFNPMNAPQALIALDMMDFDGKDELQQQIQHNYMLQQQMMIAQMQMGLPPVGAAQQQRTPSGKAEKVDLDKEPGENKQVQRSRERAQEASQPGGQVE